MRKTGWLTAAILLAFCLNANAFVPTLWAPSPIAQDEEKEDQKKGKGTSEEDKKSDDKEKAKDAEKAEDAKTTADEKPSNPVLDAIKAIAKKFDDENKLFMETARSKEFRAAARKAVKEGREQYQQFLKSQGQPDRNAYAKKMGDAAAYAIAWTAANGATNKRKAAMDYLFANHADSEVMQQVVEVVRFGVSQDVAAERLQKLIDDNPDRNVKGLAMSSLASLWSRNSAKAEEVEELYTTIVDKYADVEGRRGKIGVQAKNALFEIQYLAIGREAPDIAAADLDGVDFKLSDYRGKVVLLDFWGNW